MVRTIQPRLKEKYHRSDSNAHFRHWRSEDTTCTPKDGVHSFLHYDRADIQGTIIAEIDHRKAAEYALCLIDENGKVNVCVSPNLIKIDPAKKLLNRCRTQLQHLWFTHHDSEVDENPDKDAYGVSDDEEALPVHAARSLRDSSVASPATNPRPSQPQQHSVPPVVQPRNITTLSFITYDDSDDQDEENPKPNYVPPKVTIMSDDKKAIDDFFFQSVEVLQEMSMKEILKKLIKVIEPKKQSKYPYLSSSTKCKGGRNPRDRYPEAKVPPWWPKGVLHREPDHNTKENRYALLSHILRTLPQQMDDPIPGHPDNEIKPHKWNWFEKLQEAVMDVKLRQNPNDPKDRVERRRQVLYALFMVCRAEFEVSTGESNPDPIYVDMPLMIRPSKGRKHTANVRTRYQRPDRRRFREVRQDIVDDSFAEDYEVLVNEQSDSSQPRSSAPTTQHVRGNTSQDEMQQPVPFRRPTNRFNRQILTSEQNNQDRARSSSSAAQYNGGSSSRNTRQEQEQEQKLPKKQTDRPMHRTLAYRPKRRATSPLDNDTQADAESNPKNPKRRRGQGFTPRPRQSRAQSTRQSPKTLPVRTRKLQQTVITRPTSTIQEDNQPESGTHAIPGTVEDLASSGRRIHHHPMTSWSSNQERVDCQSAVTTPQDTTMTQTQTTADLEDYQYPLTQLQSQIHPAASFSFTSTISDSTMSDVSSTAGFARSPYPSVSPVESFASPNSSQQTAFFPQKRDHNMMDTEEHISKGLKQASAGNIMVGAPAWQPQFLNGQMSWSHMANTPVGSSHSLQHDLHTGIMPMTTVGLQSGQMTMFDTQFGNDTVPNTPTMSAQESFGSNASIANFSLGPPTMLPTDEGASFPQQPTSTTLYPYQFGSGPPMFPCAYQFDVLAKGGVPLYNGHNMHQGLPASQ